METSGGRRLIQAGLVIIGISLLVFLITATSENLGSLSLGMRASPAAQQAMTEQLGLNDPLSTRYVRWVTRMLVGDFGISWRIQVPVLKIVVERLPATLELVITALLITFVAGGSMTVFQRSGGTRWVSAIIEMLCAAAPVFWLGFLLMLIFGARLQVLPLLGRGPVGELPSLLGRLEYLIMPALVLSVTSWPFYSKWTRVAKMERGRFLCMAFANLLNNVVIVETVFAWPGVGGLTILAFVQRDYPIILALVMMMSVTVVLVSTLLDMPLSGVSITTSGRSGKLPASSVGTRGLSSLRDAGTWSSKLAYSTSTIEVALDRLRLDKPVELTLFSRRNAIKIENALHRLRGGTHSERLLSRAQLGKAGILAAGILFLVILASMSLISTQVLGQDYLRPDISSRFLPIGSPGHILGTDGLGRDFLIQLLLAGQTTLSVAVIATLIALVIGLPFGIIVGHFGGVANLLAKWLITLVNSVPAVPLFLLIATLHGIDFTTLVIMLGLVGWTDIALRARVNRLRNTRWLAIVATTLGTLVLVESYVSFLGAGSPPPELSWGGLSAMGKQTLLMHPHLSIMPGLVITIIVACLFILGDQSDVSDEERS